jgi:hypothetical protein
MTGKPSSTESNPVQTTPDTSLWQDLRHGKKPVRPKLSGKSVGLRLAFRLPFRLFGADLISRTAEAHFHRRPAEISIIRVLSGKNHLYYVYESASLCLCFSNVVFQPTTELRTGR